MVCKTTPKPSVKNYSDWRVLLEETRVTNRNGLPGKYDMQIGRASCRERV